MRHLRMISESYSPHFYDIDPDIHFHFRSHGLSDEISPGERLKIKAWFEDAGINQDPDTFGLNALVHVPPPEYQIPKENFMVFTRCYSIAEYLRMTVDVVKLSDDYWILSIERFVWDTIDEEWQSSTPKRAFKCDELRGLKAAFDATVGRLSKDYLRVERLFNAAREEEWKINHVLSRYERKPDARG